MPRLGDLLRPEHIVVPLEAATVREAVRILADRLKESGAVSQPELLDSLADERRVRDVIHVGDRILLPHLRTDAVRKLEIALGVSPRPIPSVAEDREATARIVVLVLAPPAAAELYLQTVAALARTLRHEGAANMLLEAQSAEQIREVAAVWDAPIPPRLVVRDVMTPRVYRVYPDTPVPELLDLMSRHALHAVPVLGEDREVLGLVTDRDLLRHLLPRIREGSGPAKGEPPTENRVRDIMSRSVLCISEDQGVAEAVSIMIGKDVERLPVVNDGRLTGFLTRGDIIRKLFGS